MAYSQTFNETLDQLKDDFNNRIEVLMSEITNFTGEIQSNYRKSVEQKCKLDQV